MIDTKKPVRQADSLYGDSMRLAIKIMERMINHNTESDIYSDLKSVLRTDLFFNNPSGIGRIALMTTAMVTALSCLYGDLPLRKRSGSRLPVSAATLSRPSREECTGHFTWQVRRPLCSGVRLL